MRFNHSILNWLSGLFVTATLATVSNAAVPSVCTVSLNGQRFDLHRTIQKQDDLGQVWNFISQTRTGRAVSEAYQTARRRPDTSWQIGFSSPGDWKRFGLPEKTVAMSFPHDTPMQIRVQGGATLAALAINMVHEATHLLDAAFKADYQDNLELQTEATQKQASIRERASRREGIAVENLASEHYTDSEILQLHKILEPLTKHTNQTMLNSERKAYDAQYEFSEEISALAECVRPYLQEQAALGVVVVRKFSDDDIRRHYFR